MVGLMPLTNPEAVGRAAVTSCGRSGTTEDGAASSPWLANPGGRVASSEGCAAATGDTSGGGGDGRLAPILGRTVCIATVAG